MVDTFTATFEGSSFNFTCADGLSPTTIIRTDCTAEVHWSPDPATHMCINASATITTAADMITESDATESDATDREGDLCPMTVINSEGSHNKLHFFSILATRHASVPVSSTTVVTVVCSIVFFIVGVVGGFAAGVLVVFCCDKLVHQRNHNLQPSQPPPAPLYEDVIVTTVVKDKDELELKDNVAYGHLR